jgi:hypothetical protein
VKFAIYDRNYDAERCGFEEMASTNRGFETKGLRQHGRGGKLADYRGDRPAVMAANPQTRAVA